MKWVIPLSIFVLVSCAAWAGYMYSDHNQEKRVIEHFLATKPQNSESTTQTQITALTARVRVTLPNHFGNDDVTEGSAFLINRSLRLFVTAHHMLPDAYDALDPNKNYITIDDSPAKLVCTWKEADLMIMQVDNVNSSRIEAIPDSPMFGQRVYILNPITFRSLGDIGDSGGSLTYRNPLVQIGTVLGIGEAYLDEDEATGAFYITIENEVTSGSSGGPVVNEEGKVIGVVNYGDEDKTEASSTVNIANLMMKPECAEQIRKLE